MYVLITLKFKKYQINSNQEKVETSIFRHSRRANSVVGSQIWPEFELIQALMHVLIICKYQKDRIQNNHESAWRHHFHHYKSMGVFLDIQGQITP